MWSLTVGRAFKTLFAGAGFWGEVWVGEVWVSCGKPDGCDTGVRSCSGLLPETCWTVTVGSSSPNFGLGRLLRFFRFSSVQRGSSQPWKLFESHARCPNELSRDIGICRSSGLYIKESHTVIPARTSGIPVIIVVGRMTSFLPSRLLCMNIGGRKYRPCEGVASCQPAFNIRRIYIFTKRGSDILCRGCTGHGG